MKRETPITQKEIEKSREILHKATDLYLLGKVSCIAEGVIEVTRK